MFPFSYQQLYAAPYLTASVAGESFQLADEDMATESALYDAEEPRFEVPIRLYRVYGLSSKDIRLILVEPSIHSLERKSVFLLDYGLEIYIWTGSRSTLNHTMKLRILTQRLNNSERVGRAAVEEIRQGEETERFLSLLSSEDGEIQEMDFDKIPESRWLESSEAPTCLYKYVVSFLTGSGYPKTYQKI